MNGQSMERTRHISITRTSDDGSITRTEVHITKVSHTTVEADGGMAVFAAVGQVGGGVDVGRRVGAANDGAEESDMGGVFGGDDAGDTVDAADTGKCFDPTSCCSAREQAMIAALRAYLRPEVAPECLMAKLKATLDHCCGEDGR
ncbi:hypothetical protein BMYO_1002 [Bifidobacterium myosotis]|uniref:Uncharacterized protein n=2 Tax=Bifidobacterium myosotis TaxID=1630166 RepID=A0A261FM49_9BIFI|nr:hypothetical protein [Bifidobacterium myosotis]OZG60043.1 hypothetical protein BMYO_1002 [Bifidobacterium myosotis]